MYCVLNGMGLESAMGIKPGYSWLNIVVDNSDAHIVAFLSLADLAFSNEFSALHLCFS